MPLAVSIIIPAHNAAATLAETLSSVQAQSHRDWEAIVVENGSTDSTAALAAQFAAHDPRIRVTSSPPAGVSVARNRGIELARHDWLLFLDADDWILPDHIEALTAVLQADPTLAAVHCGWRRISPDGLVIAEEFGSDDPDLFPLLGRTCVFAIHACIVKRAVVVEVGGFDPALRTCEDWDLWQRIARGGARFGALPACSAAYRTRPKSASMNGRQMLLDGFKVIARAYASDPRVPHPLPTYADGLRNDAQPIARLENLIWQAGLVLGSGDEAVDLLESVASDPAVDLDPATAATILFEAVLLPTARAPEGWARLHDWIEPQLTRFLDGLETHTRQRGLARSVQAQLERRAVRPVSLARPLTIGHTHAIDLELTSAFPSLRLPPSVERLHCRVHLEGDVIGELELPVCDGLVPADVLADAAAAEFAWRVLGRFFTRTAYQELQVEHDPTGWTVRQGSRVLARETIDDDSKTAHGDAFSWESAHDRIGWSIFLQEVWGLKAPPDDGFYALDGAERRVETRGGLCVNADWIVVEVLDPLKPRRLTQSFADVVLTVAGTPVARTSLIVPKRVLSPATLRAALMIESGYELCCACVREGLLQRPLGGRRSLRERLELARAQRPGQVPAAAPAPAEDLVPASAWTLPGTVQRHPGLVLWARRPFAPCGTSGSRRALLPAAVFDELQRLATAEREWLVPPAGPNGASHTVLYAPELVWRPRSVRAALAGGNDSPATDVLADGRFFEELFTSRPDPWHYTSDYEQTKYRQTLELLPAKRFRRALELACAEGHFTVQLAPHVDRLLAVDISTTALNRTRQRCAGFNHIDYQQCDLVHDPMPDGRFDLVVCSEVLYYTGTRVALQHVADKLLESIEPGGYLLMTHAHVCADDPDKPGFDWNGVPFGARTFGEVFGALPGLRLRRELRTPLYRVQLFQRLPAWRRWISRSAPRIRRVPQPVALPAEVEAHVRWKPAPAAPAEAEEPVRFATARLPILMYHRIASDGPASLARYRLAPEQFEAQLRYLANNDYESVTLEEWRTAREAKRALPGRRVLLTFDDGCQDFLHTAWPLLERYGFGALVFLPTDEIGGCCRWDERHGAPAPVMNWDDLRTLQKAGVEFGSHSATHPLLTGLPLEALTREALRSRASITEQLGIVPTSIAYPFGATDRAVEAVCGACGYLYGLTCDHRLCEMEDRLLALPRLEVHRDLSLESFAELLNPEYD